MRTTPPPLPRSMLPKPLPTGSHLDRHFDGRKREFSCFTEGLPVKRFKQKRRSFMGFWGGPRSSV